MLQRWAECQRSGGVELRFKTLPSERVQTQRILELRALVEKLKRVPSPPSGRRPAHKDKSVMTSDLEETGSLEIKNQKL